MTYSRPSLGNPARAALPPYARLLRVQDHEYPYSHDSYYHHKAGIHEEHDDIVVGCLWKRVHELNEHPLARRRQVVGRMFGPKASTDYVNPLDPEETLHHDTRGARRNDVFRFYKGEPQAVADGARVRLRGRTDQRHGPQSDPAFGDNQNTSWVRGTLYKEGVRAKGRVQDVVPATRTRFATDLEQLSPCWENHRIRFVSGPNRNFETYVLDYTRLNEQEPGIIELSVLLPHEPGHGDRFVLMRDHRRTVRWRAGYRAAVEMDPAAFQAVPVEGGKLYSSLYYGVRWSNEAERKVTAIRGANVSAAPAVDSHWWPGDCHVLGAYPYSSQGHAWDIPDSFFEPLYRQVFWAPDLAAGGPSTHVPGIDYRVVYGAHVYAKTFDHPLGRDAETAEIQERGVLVGSVSDPHTAGTMDWYLALVHVAFFQPFYYRDETDPEPGGGPRWTGVWPGVSWFLHVAFVCIHTTYEGNRRILGKYGDEYSGMAVPLVGIVGIEWGTGAVWPWSTRVHPHLTPAGHEDVDPLDENRDAANQAVPYRGPCSFHNRGLWWLDRDYYDASYVNTTYYPCGVYLL